MSSAVIGTSVGINVAISKSFELLDHEFRLLVLLSGFPEGSGFSASVKDLVLAGMDHRSVVLGASRLERIDLSTEEFQCWLGFDRVYSQIAWRFSL